jgi:hypothetical protein
MAFPYMVGGVITQSDGTVAARKFINLSAEKDRLKKAVGRVKKAQQKGNRKTPAT